MRPRDRVLVFLSSTFLAFAAWRLANSLFTCLAGGFSPAVQAAMLAHGNVGPVLIGFLALYLPLHIVLARGSLRETFGALYASTSGVLFIIASYFLLSRSYEASPIAVPFAALAIVGWFEARRRHRAPWKRALDVAAGVAVALDASLTTRDGLIRQFIIVLAGYTVVQVLAGFRNALRRWPRGGDRMAGRLAVYATGLMLVFALPMMGGANSGNYFEWWKDDYSPFDYFHRLAALLWVASVALHVRAVGKARTDRGQRLRMFDWRLVALWLPLFFGVEIAHTLHYTPFEAPGPAPASEPVVVSKYAHLRGFPGPDAATWFVSNGRTCATERCHAEPAAQHDRSAHGRAMENPAFKAELAVFIREQGREAADYCLACHAPLGVIAFPATGADTDIDPLTTDEPAFTVGVGCVVCHRAVPDKDPDRIGNASLTLRPFALDRQRYLGEDRDETQPLHRRLIQAAVGLHRSNMRVPKDDWNAICGACHVVRLPPILAVTGHERTVADHYLSFVDSPYARQGLTCSTCHQPRYKTHEVGYNTVDHNYLGSGSSLPHGDPTDDAVREISRGFLAGLGDVTLRLQLKRDLPPCLGDLPLAGEGSDLPLERGPDDPFAGANGKTSSRGLLKVALSDIVVRDNRLQVTVVTSNECVGHVFPPGGGLRAYLVVTVLDAGNNVVGSYGGLDSRGRPIDTDSNLGSRSADIHGVAITDRRFWNAASVLRERRLEPGASATDHVILDLSGGTTPTTLQAEWWFLRQEGMRGGVEESGRTAPVQIGKAVVPIIAGQVRFDALK